MPNSNPMPMMQPINTPQYDPRWFIWTIVFLLVTGISLVSYIMLSDTGAVDDTGITVHRIPKTQNQ